MNEELLRIHVSTVVPLMIIGIIQSGGLTDAHIREAKRRADIIAERATKFSLRARRRERALRL